MTRILDLRRRDRFLRVTVVEHMLDLVSLFVEVIMESCLATVSASPAPCLTQLTYKLYTLIVKED